MHGRKDPSAAAYRRAMVGVERPGPLHPGIRSGAVVIRLRSLDNARRELSAMTSKLEHYEDEFSLVQLRAMRKAMIALRAYIKTLEA